MKKNSLIMALLLVLLLAGCGKTATKEPQTEAETIPESTVSAEEAGFTLEDVVHANDLQALVSVYGGVQSMRYENDELCAETYYFMYAGKLVSTCRMTGADEEDAYACTVDNARYEKVGDHLQFSYDLEPEAEQSDAFAFSDAVTAQMLDGTIQWIEAPDEDTWRFELRDAENPSEVACRCTVTRDALTLKQIDWDYGDGTTAKIELLHGADVMTKEFGMLDGFAKDLRTVTCVCTMHDKQGKETEKTYKVDVPYNVEPVWTASRELNVYLDKGFTKEYKYPGNGEEGYTVYVTDAMG